MMLRATVPVFLYFVSQDGELQVVGKEAGTEGKLEAKDVVMQFYSAYNAGDVDGVMALMAQDCSYHDMIYSGWWVQPWRHRWLKAMGDTCSVGTEPDT